MVRSILPLALLCLATTGCCSMDPCTGAVHCRSLICGHSFGFKPNWGCGGCGSCNACCGSPAPCSTGCNPCGTGWGATTYPGPAYSSPGYPSPAYSGPEFVDPATVAPAYGPPAAHVPGATFSSTPSSTQVHTLPSLDATGHSPVVPPPQALPTGVHPEPTTRAPSVIRNSYNWDATRRN